MTKITIPLPDFKDPLTTLVIELEKLRHNPLIGINVPPYIFFSLKVIFQHLETLGSARIEGNHTTLSDFIENHSNPNPLHSQQEIDNLYQAISFIEENTKQGTHLNRAYFFELHKIILQEMGKNHIVGKLRMGDVSIVGGKHKPPSFMDIERLFDIFLDFINQDLSPQEQLLMIAIAHHRFEYIHPFADGNGRMGRLLNYALLIKLGFQDDKNSRIINPSSVFYTDRNKYYEKLALADSLKDKDLLSWCEYFLSGLKNEIQKIDHLCKRDYVMTKILSPLILGLLKAQVITDIEAETLELLLKQEKMEIKADSLEKLKITTTQKQKHSILASLKEKKILIPHKEGGRIYILNLTSNPLLRHIITPLRELGFIAQFLEENENI